MSGPQSILEQVSRVVLPVDQSGLRDEYRAEIAPVALDQHGEELADLTITPEKIAVVVQFVKLENQDQ